ncbi:bis-aminopropyl spermidine synthase family protein [Kutzneria viridogrisea]|uniref:Methyltransferases-like protein n=2 Tax=Kutzneria TaxID=43356 RepID=W5W8B9_9PSEU|nr:bis-aminopropyl spermidine synthase family protein [Kutzneria albida]AHH97137.1 methyltransferases-like protein [Kutzneria albida DSM 43870]MBA8931892.1 putative methyltransferase [Kutzneria viridogrisea]
MPIEQVQELVAEAGAHARPLREILAELTERPHDLASLVRTSAVSRRTVEAVLAAAGEDLVESAQGVRLRPERVPAYRELFRYEQVRSTALTDPLAARLAAHGDLVEEMAKLIAAAPKSRQALDHVSATAETAVRRALWLDATFDLDGANLLCVGDHDLTSLAVKRVNPAVSVTVVDLDERILEFIDGQGLDVRCLFTDLRFGLPTAVTGWADLLFTDPPYTPEGVRLFLARGLSGLRDRELGRLVMAYGFGERQPALGLKVQEAVQDLHLAYEAILPHFSRYDGAQAVGSASDLYVCRPTARSWKALDNPTRGSGTGPNIYTHGPQSLEGAGEALDPAAVEAMSAAAVGERGLPLVTVAESWHPASTGLGHVKLSTLLGSGLPTGIARRRPYGVAVDLSADPGAWLLRALLAVNADRVALLVPNNHPDLASSASQRELSELVAGKYALRFLRNTPDSRYALVVAELVAEPSLVLERAHGKVGNAWREALVRAGRDLPDGPLTKNQARALIQQAVPRAELLDASLLELPRHQIRLVLDGVRDCQG